MQNSNGGKVSSYLQIVCSLLQHNAVLLQSRLLKTAQKFRIWLPDLMEGRFCAEKKKKVKTTS